MGEVNGLKMSILVIGLYYYDYVRQSYKEFELMQDVDCLKPMDGPLGLVKKLVLSKTLNTYMRMPFQGWMFEKELREQSFLSRRYDTAIILECPEAFSREYLKRVSRYADSLCLVLLNPITDRHEELLPGVEDLYKLIVTCNPQDAQRSQNWVYHQDCYSFDSRFANVSQVYDLSFISVDKGRGSLAINIYTKATKLGLKCDFLIVNPTHETRKYASSGIQLTDKPLSYEQCLRRSLKAKCILEIVANNQNYCTLRTMEAVVYGRRLLTTNCSLSNDEHYDSINMQIFDDPENIDWNFVQRGFEGIKTGSQSYSVSKLIDLICSNLAEG